MATADMNRLIDHAKIRLPGALDSVIQLELFSAMDEFFCQSNIWTEDISFAVTPTSDSYFENPAAYTYPVVPSQGAVVRLIGLADAKGFPQYGTMPTPGFVILAHSPSETGVYKARVAKTVTDPVTSEGYPDFPDWILGRYGTEVLDGVLGRMMSQIAKPYSSPQIALLHLRAFKQAVAQASVEAQHQNVYRGQSWMFPQTFNRRSNVRF